ncbi:type II toxin-antitoxin system YafQ family toxin [Oscillibacter sp.]|uniref:type II toxin-antitoxin system YafQ family toxin n=1 Tax=Oscillibacter sp. TaxID=1945593 RepID=UPI002D80C82E|nr:type II toxin-antitoxin system YafQ family toxin [Oscillibacter sp.]
MLTIRYEKSFKKDYKRVKRRGYDIELLENVLELLARQEPLPPKYKDHALTGEYKGFRECHITPNWLLVYEIHDQELILVLTRTGTHSDLF